ncbi:MAG: hypothetical protein IKI97_01915 [Clostridia bacterium]|nr:hypothetical protein [Clostridia bacterium]
MFSQDNIDNFLNLSDEEIRKKLSSAAGEGKISPERLKNALSDTNRVRQVISKMSPTDVERFIRILGRENAEKMAEKLRENL